jgi:hypothetical protein
MTTTARLLQFLVKASVNGRAHRAEIQVLDGDGEILTEHRANLGDLDELQKAARKIRAKLTDKLGSDPGEIERRLHDGWVQARNAQAREDKARESAAAAPDQIDVEVLDVAPHCVRRPLSLIDDRAYAAAWVHTRITVRRTVDRRTGEVTDHDPPLVRTEQQLVVVRDDGQPFAERAGLVAGARALGELGLEARLPSAPPPAGAWSGAGLKRFLAGERPDPTEVFRRVADVVDRFIDFNRSLAPQAAMCELSACYALATYFLDAFHVIGYLWPNGDKGAGKTTYLQVIAELAYLGQLILAGGSYAALRDLADYGATLCFDDAEAVMNKGTDPDKRTLLLAGNRRGATVAVKELQGDQWVTRHVSTFCPRLFSAIRLPDDVLGSRTILLPLVRSGDARRAKSNPLDHAVWPHDRRRLVDDLWAVGLAHLPLLRDYDGRAAQRSPLVGRDLEPWRAILAVALWLEEAHGLQGLFGRMAKLAEDYQQERGYLEVRDPTRVAVRALGDMVAGLPEGDRLVFAPKDLSDRMNALADAEEPPEEGKTFTTPRKVGWLLRRLRLRRESNENTKRWSVSRAEIEGLARAYGMAAQAEKEAEGTENAEADTREGNWESF